MLKQLKLQMISVSILVVLGLFLGAIMVTAQQALPERKDIDDKYKWNLADIYPSDAEWESDYTKVQSELSSFKRFEGKIAESPKMLLDCINHLYRVERIARKVGFYAFTARDIDMTDGKYQVMADRAMKLFSDFAAATSFINPEILAMPKSKIDDFFKQEKQLETYRQIFDDLLRSKPHTLSAAEEKLIAQLSPIGGIATQTYGVLNDAELPFGNITDDEGNQIKVSHGRYRAGLFDTNRDYRRDIYKATYIPYDQLQNTFAVLFNGRVKTRIANAEIKNFNSAREAALFSNNIPINVYDNLVKTMNDNLHVLHRWAAIKKRVLKLDELHPYDTYVTLFPSVQKQYTFDEAMQLCVDAFRPLGEEYVKVVEHSWKNRWIDVFETKGKRSGAYSNSCACGAHPIILMNWNNTLDDLFTLAHEIGHNMHSYFTEKNQPYHYAGYSIFVAEVASTTNEALLLDHLMKIAQTKEEKLALLEKFLMNAQQTFFRQTRFAEFEMIIHEKAQKGEYLNAKDLTKLFAELYQKYWGPDMVTDYEEGLSWARIPHFYNYNFYVFQYSTGFAAALALSSQILNQGQPAVDRYLQNFIYAGESDYGINVLTAAGVDMSKADPIVETVKVMERYLDELERLLD